MLPLAGSVSTFTASPARSASTSAFHLSRRWRWQQAGAFLGRGKGRGREGGRNPSCKKSFWTFERWFDVEATFAAWRSLWPGMRYSSRSWPCFTSLLQACMLQVRLCLKKNVDVNREVSKTLFFSSSGTGMVLVSYFFPPFFSPRFFPVFRFLPKIGTNKKRAKGKKTPESGFDLWMIIDRTKMRVLVNLFLTTSREYNFLACCLVWSGLDWSVPCDGQQQKGKKKNKKSMSSRIVTAFGGENVWKGIISSTNIVSRFFSSSFQVSKNYFHWARSIKSVLMNVEHPSPLSPTRLTCALWIQVHSTP